MAGEHRVLPFLQTLCRALDRIFVEAVGPFGEFVTGEVRERWATEKPRTKPADVEDYVALLAAEIPEAPQRAAFVQRARDLLGRYK